MKLYLNVKAVNKVYIKIVTDQWKIIFKEQIMTFQDSLPYEIQIEWMLYMKVSKNLILKQYKKI